jgi:DNA-binding transcriptional ArsR family regulator
MSITLNDCGPAHEAGTSNSSGGFGGQAHEAANLGPSAGADYSGPAQAGSHLSGPAHEPGPNPEGTDSGGPVPSGDGIRGSAPIFAALGDKTRLALVARLCSGGPLSIARLTAGADITRQAITKHLNILAGAGLVRDIRVGRERLWEVETRQIEEARRALERISTQWDDALARLKLAVESDGH